MALCCLKSSHWSTAPGRCPARPARTRRRRRRTRHRAAAAWGSRGRAGRRCRSSLSVPQSRQIGSVRAGSMPGARRVERQLPDRDAHAAGALVAQAEDALAVGHHDQRHVRRRRVAQHVRDVRDVLGGDPQSARPPQDVAEPLAGLAHRGRVDDRGQLLEVVAQQPVEQRLVAVLQRDQPDVLLHVAALAAQVLQFQRDLLVDRRHPPRQQAAQPEIVPLLRP